MEKIAFEVKINTEVKEAFVLDTEGNETSEKISFREFDILDENGEILETGRYTQESITVDEVLKVTGIQLGYSKYIIN